jgi:glycosidase
MKRFVQLLFVVMPLFSTAQVVTISPEFPTIDDEITLTFDVTQATDSRADGLLGLTSDVFLWSGAGDENEAFRFGPPGQDNFGEPYEPGTMTSEGNDVWSITLTPRDYYQIPQGTRITRLGVLLKNGDGSSQTEDLFVDIDPGKFVTRELPVSTFNLVSVGQNISVAYKISESADLDLQFDTGTGFTSVATASAEDSIGANYTVVGNEILAAKIIADFGDETIERIDSIELFTGSTLESLPAGVRLGQNFDPNDDTKVTLAFLAPQKSRVHVVGDFTNWEVDNNYQMKLDPDTSIFWLEVTGLTPGQEYIYQFWVDDQLKVLDPYSDKIADPFNDRNIPESVYPGLIDPDTRGNGRASILQTAQEEFQWDASEDTWERPDPDDLLVYEMFMGDFLDSHDYKDMIDTLDYFERLGINAIELMPPIEHEGDAGWGYDPYAMFATEKFYGRAEDLKAFIQACHQRGIAVINDIVLNHQTGANPFNRMYFNPDTNKPDPNSPFFNEDAKHPFNVFEDMNHESPVVQIYVDSIVQYWIHEFHFDGYRFDLSKGFTQNDTGGDVAEWGRFDQTRIDLIQRIGNAAWAIDSTTYMILEHFADSDEEQELGSRGFLLWGNNHGRYTDLATGNNPNSNIGGIDNPIYVNYIVSHDEPWPGWEMAENGQVNGDYDVKAPENRFNREKLLAAFFYTAPGPKMIWQFQEWGYDGFLSPDGGNRTNPKPTIWNDEGDNLNYYNDPERRKIYDTFSALINLSNDYSESFPRSSYDLQDNGFDKYIIYDNNEMDVLIAGNFDLQNQNLTIPFTQLGTWYDYLSGDSINVKSVTQTFEYGPGEFHVYTTERLPQPGEDLVPWGSTYEPFYAVASVDKPLVEEGETLTLTVVNEIEVSGDQQISVTVTEGADDVMLEAATLTIPDGQTMISTTISVNDDIEAEDRETVTITIAAASDGISVDPESNTTSFEIAGNDQVLGLEELEKFGLSIYPNPAERFLNIKSTNRISEVQLYSIDGKSQIPITVQNGQLDVSGLASGVYILEFLGDDLDVRTRLVIR